jgi:uncharacterized protein
MSAQLLHGTVWHRRLRPREHAFRYPMFQLRYRLGDEASLAGPLLSLERFNLFSLYARDHGARDGSPLLPWVRAQLAAAGLAHVDGEIWLQTLPRMLGYVFNPISFFFCHGRAGTLQAVLCEVSSTFGGHHVYLIAHPGGGPVLPAERLSATKHLHVSPFCLPRGGYRFRFDIGAHHSRIRIDYDDGHGPLLQTAVAGAGRPLSSAHLLATALRYPWLTLTVWLRIHWQALRLWLKGTPFYGKRPQPAPTQETV